MSRWARNKDGNHAGIVRAFRACGASVSAIESAEAGVPDLVVGIYGLTELVEVKDGGKVKSAQQLSDAQVKWHTSWKGRPVQVVRSIDDAVELVSRMRGAMTMSEVAR